MIEALLSSLTASAAAKGRRAMAIAVAGLFLLAALSFAIAAGWLWLSSIYGVISANLICAGALALIACVILATSRPDRAEKPHPAPAAIPAAQTVPRSTLVEELVAAYLAGSDIGRKLRK